MNSIGGVLSPIKLIPTEGIFYLTESGSFSLYPNALFDEVCASNNSASFSETKEKDDSGYIYTSKVTFQLSPINSATEELLKKYSTLSFACSITTKNGEEKILGKKDKSCILSYDSGVSDDFSRNSYIVSVSFSSNTPSIIVNNP